MSESENFGVYNRRQKNPNFLTPNKFVFRVTKLPETSWASRSANIPSTSMDVVRQRTSLNPIPRSTTNLQYEPLEVEFIVDEDFNNYSELMNWMRLMAMPVNNEGYSQLKLQDLAPGPEGGLTSDATLHILTNESVPNFTVFFRDAFPFYLSELRFSNNTDNPEEQVATVRFDYTYFDFEPTDPSIAPQGDN